MEERDQTPPDWHDIPAAEPQIQKDYEAALGAFLVTVNRIENTTNEIIHLAPQTSGRQDILKHIQDDFFNRRLVTEARNQRFVGRKPVYGENIQDC